MKRFLIALAILAVITFSRIAFVESKSLQIPHGRLIALQVALLSVAAACAGFAVRRFGTLAVCAAAVFVLASRGAFVCATASLRDTLVLVFISVALAILMNGTGAWRAWTAIVVPFVLIFAVERAPAIAFYEGMNPNATGYGGAQPRVVADLHQPSADAYRIVASGAAGHPMTASDTNRYWMAKGFVFMHEFPWAALRLLGRKLLYALHSYETYDDAALVRRDRDLSVWPIFLPFAVMAGLWTAALRKRLATVPWAFVIATLVPMIVFGVTAGRRNALIPAAAVLAAIGVAEIFGRGKYLPAIGAAVIAILLSVNGTAQREDNIGWFGWRNLFDHAVDLEKSGHWMEADIVLQDLGDYRPMRKDVLVSSVAYYRARAAVHLGRDPRALLAQAAREAPGNEHVLALRAVTGKSQWAEHALFELHDPFTARQALLEARR